MPDTLISQIERGLKSPSFKTLIALAQALNVKAHILVSDVEDDLDKSPNMRS
jgi:transcriptional regulator with XRE-family HTH domain